MSDWFWSPGRRCSSVIWSRQTHSSRLALATQSCASRGNSSELLGSCSLEYVSWHLEMVLSLP